MRYFLTLLLAILPVGLSFAQEMGYPFLRNYTPKEYDSSPQAFGVAQDSKGVMYFGMAGGDVVEYDGSNWSIIEIPDKTAIYSLATDANDIIYVAAVNRIGYLKTNGSGKKEFVDLTPRIENKGIVLGLVRQIRLLGDNVYFICADAIFEYSPQQQGPIKAYLPQKGNRLAGLFVHDGALYAHESNKGLMKLGNDGFELVSAFYKDKPYRVTFPISKEKLLIPVRGDNFYVHNLTTATSEVFRFPKENFMLDNNVFTLAPISNERLVMGSTSGLFVMAKSGEILQEINESKLLQSNNVYYAYNSPNQNLWMGLSNGITRSEISSGWTYWNKNAGLKGGVIDIQRFNNRLYFTTTNAICYLDNNEVMEVSGVPNGQCWDLLEFTLPDQRKILLVGTQFGLYEVRGSEATLIYKNEHTFKLHTSTQDPNRILASTISEFTSFRFDHGKWEYEGKWEGIDQQIREILDGEDGELWLGTTDQGIFRVVPNEEDITKPKKVAGYAVKDGLPSLRTINPFRIKNKVVFGTESGLYSYNKKTNRFEPNCELDKGLCNKDVFRLYESGEGRITILPFKNKDHDIGYYIPKDSGGYDWVYKPFRALPLMELDHFVQDEDGVVWIGGSEGLYRYDQKSDAKNYDADYFTLLRKVTIGQDSIVYYGGGTPTTKAQNGKALSIEQGLEDIDYSFHDIKFEFAAPFYDEENKTRYSYQLVGFDADWSRWSPEGYGNYTNLKEGEYTFRVKAKNVYDKESLIAAYKLHILPPIYRTWWAYVLYISLLAVMVYGIVKWNTRRLESEKIELEKIITKRTVEIVQQKEEISVQAERLKSANEELNQHQEELVLLNESLEQQKQTVESTYKQLKKTTELLESSIMYASNIQEVVMPEEKTLRAFFQDFFILYKPKNIVSGDFYWFSEINKNMGVLALADCTGHGVPGAFMSMLGSALLHESVNVQKLYADPAQVLTNIHQALQKILKQLEGRNTDGMDISICCFEKRGDGSIKLLFAGAKSKMWYISENKILEIRGDKQFVGGRNPNAVSFNNQEFILPKDTLFYLFTDGFADQNNVERRKIGSKDFKDFIFSSSKLPFEAQKEKIDALLHEHQGNEMQRDDISVLGFRLG